MKRIITIVAIALLALSLAAPVLADESKVFQAEVNQSVLVSNVCEAGICHTVFQGSGAANIMGSISFTFHAIQDFTTTPCSEFSGVMTLEGATGTVTLLDEGFVCPGSGPYSYPNVISGSWVIAGGTGEFEGITGSGTDEGVIGGNGPVVHYSGEVAY